CLQDNNENEKFHKELVGKIGEKTLHPIQFEELCARFIYSNYLLKKSPVYKVVEIDGRLRLEAIPSHSDQHNLFNPWDDSMYAQVLVNYWKPWGLVKSDIVTFPDSPISYLVDEYKNDIIDAKEISLPS
nr:hypothetical protein [Bacteroidota bacterium]